LLEADRIDLIENVLRGYNPGGRVYAVIALMRLRKKGRELKPDVLSTLKRVINLNIPITMCDPCEVKPERRAKEIIGRFVSMRAI
jgi:hypothetical protein